jgi:hypothetical protein
MFQLSPRVEGVSISACSDTYIVPICSQLSSSQHQLTIFRASIQAPEIVSSAQNTRFSHTASPGLALNTSSS